MIKLFLDNLLKIERLAIRPVPFVYHLGRRHLTLMELDCETDSR